MVIGILEIHVYDILKNLISASLVWRCKLTITVFFVPIYINWKSKTIFLIWSLLETDKTKWTYLSIHFLTLICDPKNVRPASSQSHFAKSGCKIYHFISKRMHVHCDFNYRPHIVWKWAVGMQLICLANDILSKKCLCCI